MFWLASSHLWGEKAAPRTLYSYKDKPRTGKNQYADALTEYHFSVVDVKLFS